MISAIKKKYNNIPIILGGNHASVSYDVIMHNNPGIDFIIRGESEYTFLEFVKKIGTGTDVTGVPSLVWREGSEIRNNPLSPVIGSLDDLPFPAWHLLSMESYFEIAMPPNPFIQSGRVGVIMTSRGCPFKCYFCSSTNFFGHRFRPMSSSCVIEMVRLLVKSYGIKELQIVDDTFTTDFRRVIEICKGLKQFNLRITLPNGIRADSPKNRMQRAEMFHVLREAGCVQIAIAAEHGDQDFLNNVINKKLNLDETNATCDFAHRAGLLVHCNFIMGFPFETSELRNRTIEYANKLQADSFSVSLATPLPGTRMWDIAEENDLFLDGFNESSVIFSQASIKPHDIEVEELEQLVKRLNHDLNANAVGVTEVGKTFNNYNTIGSNVTTTISATKNEFLVGTISVTSPYVWTVTGEPLAIL